MRRWRRLGAGLARGLLFALASLILLAGSGVAALQTAWGRERVRTLIVGQANRYLTATLEIDSLGGSLFSGVELGGVRLSRDGQTIVAIDALRVSYRLRELVDGGTTIRQLVLERPRVMAARQPDGRWNLGALVRSEARGDGTSGPRRPIHIQEIEIHDGEVSIRDPLSFGGLHVPSSFSRLDTTCSFAFEPVAWTLSFSGTSFTGAEPDLTVASLTGTLASGEEGWQFRALRVVTPASEFTVDGRVDRRQSPTTLDLAIAAPRFAFQEWGGVLGGLRNIAVAASFDARLLGPAAALTTQVTLRSNGGDASGNLVLDTTVPGWHAKGDAAVQRLDLARWLNRPESRSDISGRVGLDIDLNLGGHFPRGAFTFNGPHAAYLGYAADQVVARGTITASEVHIASATAAAYGASVQLVRSTLGIDTPFPFRFIGTARGVDLRRMPRTLPLPLVESRLAFDYDVTGQFADAYIRGSAQFADSTFLGATVAAGASGTVDTSLQPFTYAGTGHIDNVDLNEFGRQLDIAWLVDPRYAGVMSGSFRADGTGGPAASMKLSAGGHLEQADLFRGRLLDAEVTLQIADGSLEGTYDGELSEVDPAIAMADPLYAARLTGHARGRVTVADLMVRSPELNDYTLDAALTAHDSVIRGFEVSRGTASATLDQGTLRIDDLVASSPGVDLLAQGTLELDGLRSSNIAYDVTRSDLSRFTQLVGRDMTGGIVTTGNLTGPLDRFRFQGDGTLMEVALSGVEAFAASATYDVTIPIEDPTHVVGRVDASATSVKALGHEFSRVDTKLAYDAGRLTATLAATTTTGLSASADGVVQLDLERGLADIDALSFVAQHTSWRLAPGARPHVTWTNAGVTVTSLDVVDVETAQQQLAVAGSWNATSGSDLRIAARGLSIDALETSESTPAQYGGLLEGSATVTGPSDAPRVAADFVVVQGRVRRLAFQRFAGHVDYSAGNFEIDVKLDQSPGVWLVAAGTVPMAVLDAARPEEPIRLSLKSSEVGLTLLEGVTDVVRNMNGSLTMDVDVLGTSRDPHFSGTVDLTDASFEIVSSGARYRRGRLALRLATDRVGVETLHLEDESGHPLDVTGSLGTHELRVGDLQVQVKARAFQVLRNEYGQMNVDASLSLTGEFESPRLAGRLTVVGGSLNVDRILDRTLFQPYATEQTPLPVDIDAIVALNPWERLGLDVELHVPGSLRIVGDNIQVSSGTPLGLGNIKVRAFGDLYLYKDPAQPVYVSGSLDSLTGTYAFQGKRFDLDPASSIVFRGDFNPELYVSVNRTISGVDTRVSIVGPMSQPELRLSSIPPLDPSEVLSLIVFGSSTNELTAVQQQQLAVRAGTLAAGFIAAPMVAALERSLGIDTLAIETGTNVRAGPRVTVGDEIAPGLVARFSRQFGVGEYDEATLEYYLSRILRIRATFSDANTLTTLSPFQHVVERAGIDLLFFFSF